MQCCPASLSPSADVAFPVFSPDTRWPLWEEPALGCFGGRETQANFCVSRRSSPFAMAVGCVFGIYSHHYRDLSVVTRDVFLRLLANGEMP